MRFNMILLFNVFVSAFGLLVVLIWASNPPLVDEDLFWRKPLIGSVFGLICLLGILAAFIPKQCSKSFHFHGNSAGLDYNLINTASHHPDCEEFSAHIIHTKRRKFCAACTGLILGATIALIGTAFYFFTGWNIENGFLVVLAGEVATVFGFFQLRFKSFVRSMFNALFVLGAFLVLVGVDSLTESLMADLFLVALIVFLILTRIQLSQWDHSRICRDCTSPCGIGDARRK